MGDKIPLTEIAVRLYLRDAIQSWRQRRDKAVTSVERDACNHYVDAFQSVHISLFGETVPVPG